MDILITICARGGSKGIPGKNVRILNGKPLIEYSIAVAKEFALKNNGQITISSDNEEILAVGRTLGIVTEYVRPDFLATDNAGKVDAIRHIVDYEEKRLGSKFSFVLDLDVTSPLRTLKDLEDAYALMKTDENALTLFSVNEAARNPYFNMVERQGDGYYQLSKKLESTTLTRQSAPEVYDLNASFYFYNRAFFESGFKGVITDSSLIYKMDHICFDLDHPVDFEFMDFLMKNGKLGFDLI